MHQFICLSSYPDVSIILEQGKSGLIGPHDLLPLIQYPIFKLHCSLKLFFQLASLSEVILRQHLFSPSPLSFLCIVCAVMLLLSLFYCHVVNLISPNIKGLPITKLNFFFLGDNRFPLSFQFLILRLTVPNLILVTSVISLDVFFT